MNRNLKSYKISVRIGREIVVRHEHGWNGKDAMERLSRLLREQGHTLYTMSILEQRDIQ